MTMLEIMKEDMGIKQSQVLALLRDVLYRDLMPEWYRRETEQADHYWAWLAAQDELEVTKQAYAESDNDREKAFPIVGTYIRKSDDLGGSQNPDDGRALMNKDVTIAVVSALPKGANCRVTITMVENDPLLVRRLRDIAFELLSEVDGKERAEEWKQEQIDKDYAFGEIGLLKSAGSGANPPKADSKMPRVPAVGSTRLRVWKTTWQEVRGQWAKDINVVKISQWLQNNRSELTCSPETLRDIIAAGEAGLLDQN